MIKKKIVILGSTGSIGISTLEVIKKNKSSFDVVLLSANNNYKKLIQQAKYFKAKNVLIKNNKFYKNVKNALKKNNTNVFTGDISLSRITSEKIDYVMAAIVGIAGLQPTIDVIKIIVMTKKSSITFFSNIVCKRLPLICNSCVCCMFFIIYIKIYYQIFLYFFIYFLKVFVV